MINMSYISEATGLSRYTVSRVLNGSGKVHPDTARRVLDACEKYGYVKNFYAEKLVRGGSNLIGVSVPYFTDDFYGEFVSQLDRAARTLGKEIIYRASYNDPETECEIIAKFLGLKVCAMIIVPTVKATDRRIHRLARNNVPVIYFDRRPADDDIYWVGNDNAAGIEAITAQLLAAGRTPAFLGSFYGGANSAAAEREVGYRAAMAAASRAPRLVDLSHSGEQQDNERFGYQNMAALLRREPPPDAVVCITDAAAVGAIRALTEAGCQAGGDIAVTGHDNLRYAEFITPALTTVKQEIGRFADVCLELIETLLRGETPPQREYRFKPEIIIRESFRR